MISPDLVGGAGLGLAKWLGAGVMVAGGLVAANWSLQSPTPICDDGHKKNFL